MDSSPPSIVERERCERRGGSKWQSAREALRSALLRQPDGLDLDELTRVAERGDAQERARRPGRREALLDDGPDAKELRSIVRRDVDRRLDDLLQARAGRFERSLQVLERGLRLEVVVTGADDLSCVVQRTGSGREDEPGPWRRNGRVFVRRAGEQGWRADKVRLQQS
jgi:hypothetical protein